MSTNPPSYRQNSFLNNIVYRKTHGLGAGISEFTDPITCYNHRSWGFTQCRVIYKYDKVDYSYHALDQATSAPIDGTMVVHVCDTPDNIEKFIAHPDIFIKDINYNGKTNSLRLGAYDFIDGGWMDNADKNWVNRYFTDQTMNVSYVEELHEASDLYPNTTMHGTSRDLYGNTSKYIRRFHINPDEDFYLLTFKTNDYLVYLAAKFGMSPISRMLAFSSNKYMRCADILSFIDLIKANEKSLEKSLKDMSKNFSETFVKNFPKYF